MRNLLIVLLFFTRYTGIFSQIPPKPEPARYVNDYSNLLDENQERKLEQKLLRFFKESSAQIVFVIIDTLPAKTTTIESFTSDWFNTWGIGTKGKDNGILVMVVVKERKLRIEVGYGFEEIVTDAMAAQVIDKNITPNFKSGLYAEGLSEAADVLIKATKGEFIRFPNPDKKEHWKYILHIIFILPLFALAFSIFGRKLFNRSHGIAGGLVVFAVITFFGYVILDVFLWDKEIGLGYFILGNMYGWFGFLLLVSFGTQAIFIFPYIGKIGSSLSFFHFLRLCSGVLFLGVLWWLTAEIKTQTNYPLEVIFIAFHLLLFAEFYFFYRQKRGIGAIIMFNDYANLENAYWTNILPYYTYKSIRAFRNKYKHKIAFRPLFMVGNLYQIMSDFSEIFSAPDKYLQKRADFEFVTLYHQFIELCLRYASGHQKILEAKIEKEKADFEQFAENAEMPERYKVEYVQSLKFWKDMTSSSDDDSFFMLYLKIKNFLNEVDWQTKSRQYQRPDQLLQLRNQCQTEFEQVGILTLRKEELNTMFNKQEALLSAAEKELPKRNDLIIVPAIEQVLNLGIFEDPIYLLADRTRYKAIAEKEKEFFEKYASVQLNEDDQKRLQDSITMFKTLFSTPEQLLGYDIAFLKGQYDLAQKWNWEQYTGIYTEISISASKGLINSVLSEIEDAKFSPESMVNLYKKGILKILTTLAKIQTSTYSSSSSSSYSSSSSSSSYSDYSDYKDYSDYSDSSYGGGSSGGGGASGGW